MSAKERLTFCDNVKWYLIPRLLELLQIPLYKEEWSVTAPIHLPSISKRLWSDGWFVIYVDLIWNTISRKYVPVVYLNIQHHLVIWSNWDTLVSYRYLVIYPMWCFACMNNTIISNLKDIILTILALGAYVFQEGFLLKCYFSLPNYLYRNIPSSKIF